jgi:hypothetical protein
LRVERKNPLSWQLCTKVLDLSECINLLRLSISRLSGAPGELADLLATDSSQVRQLVLRLLTISTEDDPGKSCGVDRAAKFSCSCNFCYKI